MVLQVDNISRTFKGPDGAVTALSPLSLSVAPGEFVAVRGASGSGKTTLLLIAGCLLRPSTGSVAIDGEDPYALSPNRRSRLRADKIGFVFQQFHLIPYLNVLDNILAPSVAHPHVDARTRAEALLAQFNLEHRAHHVPSQLSTGERQRTALARALLNRPRLLLADEPTGNLDEDNVETMFGYLNAFVKVGGAILLVTHDERAAAHAQRTIRIAS